MSVLGSPAGPRESRGFEDVVMTGWDSVGSLGAGRGSRAPLACVSECAGSGHVHLGVRAHRSRMKGLKEVFSSSSLLFKSVCCVLRVCNLRRRKEAGYKIPSDQQEGPVGVEVAWCPGRKPCDWW